MAGEIDITALMKKMNGGNMSEDTNKYKNYDPQENRNGKNGGGGGNWKQNGGSNGSGNWKQSGSNGSGNRKQNSGSNGGGSWKQNSGSNGGGSWKQNSGSNGGGNWKQNSGSNGGGNWKQNGGGGRPVDFYVGAPYNFVSFSNQVYQYPEGKLTAHNDMNQELSTGEISYEITAVTPIFVDDGNQEFHTDPEGRYSIPGSTLRGLIRNNVQILGLSGFADDIDDYALMYRNVAAGLEQDRYKAVLGADTIPLNTGAKNKQVSVLKNVKAGYVKKEGGKYYIYRTAVDKLQDNYGEMNYYPLSEWKIIEEYLGLEDKSKFSYAYFRQGGKNMLQNEFSPFHKKPGKNGKVQYEGTDNRYYVPYMKEISYELRNLKDVTAVGAPGKYSRKGYVVSTGKMRQKKVIYIIPEIDRKQEPIQIPDRDVEAFCIDYKKRENKLPGAYKSIRDKVQKEQICSIFNLPEEGETKPVFYICLAGRLYFGFTPRLRLFYDHTIREGLNPCHRKSVLDYASAMFGYTDDGKKKEDLGPGRGGSYKTKLSFSDAVIESMESGQLCAREDVILGEPSPTSCLNYLKSKESGAPATYNRRNFELRGVKQYWLHEKVASRETTSDNQNVASGVHALKAGVKFRGKVRFQNLTKDELGLLLWSMGLNPESRMNVGKAKSYGYGQIQVHILEAKEIDLKKAYGTADLSLDPFRPIKVEETVKFYKDTVNAILGSGSIDDMPHIREFFAMKDSALIPDNERTRYMTLDDYKEQMQKRNQIMLPSVAEVVKKESK